MTALTITAASVVPQSNAIFADHIAGETITAGMSVYIDTTTNKAMKADANASALTSVARGIATHGASRSAAISTWGRRSPSTRPMSWARRRATWLRSRI